MFNKIFLKNIMFYKVPRWKLVLLESILKNYQVYLKGTLYMLISFLDKKKRTFEGFKK